LEEDEAQRLPRATDEEERVLGARRSPGAEKCCLQLVTSGPSGLQQAAQRLFQLVQIPWRSPLVAADLKNVVLLRSVPF